MTRVYEKISTRLGMIDKIDMAIELDLPRQVFDRLVKSGVLPRPSHSLHGRRLYYRQSDVAKLRKVLDAPGQ